MSMQQYPELHERDTTLWMAQNKHTPVQPTANTMRAIPMKRSIAVSAHCDTRQRDEHAVHAVT
eukprot:m.80235 g.80235  ORF g.80235 m.80235 type:complete len:63 (-) comp16291_c0_seq25:2790-2978(-)